MNQIIIALNSLVAAANAIQATELYSGHHLNDLANIARELGAKLGENVANTILNGRANATVSVCPFTPAEQQLHFDGLRLNAVKSLLERTGMGLKEAKELSDKFRDEFMYQGMDGKWYKK